MVKQTILKALHRFGLFQFAKKLYWTTLSVCASHGVLSDLWYLFSGTFRREHRAVLVGRTKHKRGFNASKDDGAAYTLRRNTHRIEKGLIMRPRRDVFALDYIAETVRMYHSLANLSDSDSCHAETLAWSRDVLGEYFNCVDGAHPIIAKAKRVFEDSKHAPAKDDIQRRPYQRDLNKPIGITIDQLHDLAYRRRSCRWFLQQPVPRELIDRAIEIGTLAPSACNRQPFQFRIFDRAADAERIGKIPGGTAGFFENFPCVIVLVGELSAFPAERDRHIPYIDASLAAMGFQFALEVQGLSSCCINWPDIESREQAIEKAMDLSPEERVIMLIAVGYPDPDAMVPYSQKKPLSEIRSYFAN